MELEIIPKQEYIPPFDSQAIKIQRIEYFDWPYQEYDGAEITENIIVFIETGQQRKTAVRFSNERIGHSIVLAR